MCSIKCLTNTVKPPAMRLRKGGGMGFKCPLCLKDFDKDKAAWFAHIEKEHRGLGKDVVNFTIKTCEKDEETPHAN